MNPIQVLIADDEEELVSTLAERLAIRGVEAEWATTAESALEMLKERKYDIALIDVKLPGISGFDLQRKMAQMAPEMNFLFMTGHGSPGGFTGENSDADLYDCLFKPVDIDELVRKIHEITGQQG